MPMTSEPCQTSEAMPMATNAIDRPQKKWRLPIQLIFGVPIRLSILIWPLSNRVFTNNWNTHRVTTMAVNILATTPRPSVTAKPRTSSVPIQPRIRQVIRVVTLASKMALNARL